MADSHPMVSLLGRGSQQMQQSAADHLLVKVTAGLNHKLSWPVSGSVWLGRCCGESVVPLSG
jgi:hypothetical protein